ncbi:MAG: glycogen debranching enzyme N-terminal domain-containing protein [Acidobacteria bacterium]|nr:glycogen debranching enzyme N-terminal domain-containing protein [Acidobacteriota bacterium]
MKNSLMIEFDQEICGNLKEALPREWIETNGIGGFASSTIIGLNTRRYHALLTAATRPPAGRMVLLSKLEETLIVNGERYDLSANQYPNVIHPHGYHHLKSFRLDPFPIFTYEVAGIEIEKTLFMVYGENTTVIQYKRRKKKKWVNDCLLELRPLVAFRDFHSTTHENNAIDGYVSSADGLASIRPYHGLPELHFAHDEGELIAGGYWYRDFIYKVERERGLDFTEDLFSPFSLKFDLNTRTGASIIASTEKRKINDVTKLKKAETERRKKVISSAPSKDNLLRSLFTAADQFIVAREEQMTIIAGYHWFSDWGRDTMISLPGLTLATGHPEIAKSILLGLSKHIDQGMLPNRFPDVGEQPEYNTVDATLWYFEAVRALLQHTNDYKFVHENIYEGMVEIINWHERGTRYHIHVEDDGLLYAGEPGVQLTQLTQLTWMDARVDDWVVTPRVGKPVEIQALWYNALRVMEDLASRYGDEANKDRFCAMAARARDSFNRKFWNEEIGCLYDVIDGETHDGSIRPNQIFTISLTHPVLDPDRAQRVVEVVEAELLTPVGLRSLSPNDPQYRSRYEGDIRSRDGAYHQGTVWPWLIGPYISAYLKVMGNTKVNRKQAKKWLAAFSDQLTTSGLAQVSEIFDADSPHRPGGCIAQAWSVAELLRVMIEFELA